MASTVTTFPGQGGDSAGWRIRAATGRFHATTGHCACHGVRSADKATITGRWTPQGPGRGRGEPKDEPVAGLLYGIGRRPQTMGA
jgi:hypothetical protein